MRIYRRAEFMKLPAGTLFCKAPCEWAFDGISVKGDTFGNDWSELRLCDIEAHDSCQLDERMDEMLKNGASYPMHDSYGRDGCFAEGDLFLVYEIEDLKRLHAIICEAVKVA